jgi:energy-coupling factor transporter ATP-binding protein EcfA2
VQTTTSPFSVEEAEKRVRALRPPRRAAPDLRLHLRSTSRSGDLVIRTRALEVGYPGKLLFRAPDIELRRADCAALIGPNGAGKSTLLKTILGQLEPVSGKRPGRQSAHGLPRRRTRPRSGQNGIGRDHLPRPACFPTRGAITWAVPVSGDDAFQDGVDALGRRRGRLALAKLA